MRKRVLVADDDPAILDSLRLLLEDEGYEVSATTDAGKVIDGAAAAPDVILLDIWMSGLDGSDILRQLRARPDTAGIPVVMISANRDAESIARAAGATRFRAKPFDADDLLRDVAACLGLGSNGGPHVC